MPNEIEDIFFTEPDDDGENEGEVVGFESDPSVTAYLDQESAAFRDGKQAWLRIYGFEHNCRCGQDYTEGKLGEVTECFMRLTQEALSRCAEATHENNLLSTMIEQLLNMNNDLAKMLEEAGLTKELEDYFNTEVDEAFDQPQEESLEQLVIDELEAEDDGAEDES